MLQKTLAKIFLFPFTLIYGVVISMRNIFYDAGLLKSTSFNIPIINIGNLSIGGAGKTPHIEYLIRELSPFIDLGTLSRGYKRKTKGFRFVQFNDNARTVGDEPLMYKRKYRDIVVAVSESRTLAVPLMIKQHPNLQLILLDDAFQHKAIIPGLNILLTTYDDPFMNDTLLPAGRLREYPSAYLRADIIVVTKCPNDIHTKDKEAFIKRINPAGYQKIFFTKYKYYQPYSFYDFQQKISLDSDLDIILVSAIANTSYLKYFLEETVESIHELEYEDHHIFTERDINYIHQVYSNRETPKKIILTTEKDAMRLDLLRKQITSLKLPIFILPVEVEILFEEEEQFIDLVKSFLLNFKV